MRIPLIAALGAVALAPSVDPSACPTPLAATGAGPPTIVCTPTSVIWPSGAVQSAAHPIVAALEGSQPGSLIQLQPGDYGPFTLGFDNVKPNNSRTNGGAEGVPVIIDGGGRARIVGRDGDAISINQQIPVQYVTFRNLTIQPGARAGVLFFKQNGPIHRGFAFEDVDIIASFDHATGQGGKSKWGVWGHSLADFRYAGVRRPARIENIRYEHAFYLQNPRGDMTIENVHARQLGRTFCQFTARRSEGPEGVGKITVRDCVVEDVGLSEWDGYKGGSAFTVAGRLRGTILFENNQYRAGFERTLTRLTKGGKPYGTGAFVAWRAPGEEPNGTLILRDNEFRFADGCGDRPVVSIGGCDKVLIIGNNRFYSGGSQPALSLDPPDGQGRIDSPNGPTVVAPNTYLRGSLLVGGQERALADVNRLQRQG